MVTGQGNFPNVLVGEIYGEGKSCDLAGAN